MSRSGRGSRLATSPEAGRKQRLIRPELSTGPLGELSSLEETVVIKDGNLFVLSARDGSLPLGLDHPLGLYYEDCRFLCGHELRIAGARPRLLIVSSPVGAAAIHELTNPDIKLAGGSLLPLRTLQIRLERAVVGPREVEERIVIHSYHPQEIELPLELRLAADFEPMLAIRGVVEGLEPLAPAVEAIDGGIAIRARGRDGIERQTAVVADPAPSSAGRDGLLRFPLRLAPAGERSLYIRFSVGPPRAVSGARPRGDRIKRAQRASGGERWLAQRTSISSDDQLFDRIVRRSLLDLRMLRSRARGQSYYAAGIPWFATLFGRDSLITAIEMLAFDPSISQETIRLLARMIGRGLDDRRDEEPGKIVHEMRVGEVERLKLTPFARYYGTVDATPLFLCLLCEQADWSGGLVLFRELREEIEAALEWIDRYGDLDGDGLIEYRSRSEAGLRNHGWKDSDNAIVDERGAPLEPPIAVLEAQAYAFRAKRRLSRLFEQAGEGARAERLRAEAAELAKRLEAFWLEREGYYAMALDGAKRPSRALASNQGHLLWGLAVPQARANRIRKVLMGESMFSGWGIRSLAEGEAGYNPTGYHTGSVWPHDSALIAFGLLKYGFDRDFRRIFEALLEGASQLGEYRLPELFAGFSRGEYERPVPYPVACRPQAWAAGAIPYLLKASLGLIADGLERRLRVVRPSLPSWVNRLSVRNLRLAGSRIDLEFERAGEHVTLADARIDGDVEVVLEISASRQPVLE